MARLPSFHRAWMPTLLLMLAVIAVPAEMRAVRIDGQWVVEAGSTRTTRRDQYPATPAPAASPARLQPTDLVYLGAFAFPAGDAWTYSGHALAYYLKGDPLGPDDGHPGSLYTVGHAWNQLVGEISIPEPVISEDFDDLPQASVLQPLTDITGGWLANCQYAPGCLYREVAGLEYLPNIERIAWNLRDWYNVGGLDQDSLGWSQLNLTGAQGVWHIGERGPTEFHNAKTSNYLFRAPVSFAQQFLEGKWLLAGNHRLAGAFGGSQGPSLIAVAPWEDGSPPAPGQELDALALLFYPEVVACTQNQFDLCYFPGYRADDDWGGGAWVETANSQAVLMVGRKGLGNNCYGDASTCPGSLCDDSQGYHSDPYEPQILFYDPADLAAAAAGTVNPWQVLPYAVHRPLAAVFGPDCGRLSAAAYDPAGQFIYVTEEAAGPDGATAVHVWHVAATDPCPWDVDQNGDIDRTDLSLVAQAWGSSQAQPGSGYDSDLDVDRNGVIDVLDVQAVAGRQDTLCPSGS